MKSKSDEEAHRLTEKLAGFLTLGRRLFLVDLSVDLPLASASDIREESFPSNPSRNHLRSRVESTKPAEITERREFAAERQPPKRNEPYMFNWACQ